MEVIAQAGDAEEAWQQTRQLFPRLLPDVVVLDVPNHHYASVQVTKRLKTSYPSVRVLGIAGQLDEVHLSQMLKAGAAGYLLKTSHATGLKEAIHRLAQGETYLDPSIKGEIRNGGLYLSTPNSVSEILSAGQVEILKLVAWGYTNAEIAKRMYFSIKTIEAHKLAIRKKLGLRTQAEMVRFSYQHGWLNREE